MSRKNSLAGAKITSAQSLASSFNSAATNIQFLDSVGIQINATGTASGSFAVQVSQDYDPTKNVAGNWIALSLSGTPALSGAADNIEITLQQIPAQWLRVAWTATSGTGNCDIFVSAKEI